MKKLISLIVLTLLVSACKDTKKKSAEMTVDAEEVVKPEVLLFSFNGGMAMVHDLELFSQDTTYHGQTKEFANPFYVIKHPKGNLMWDAGLPEAFVGAPPFTTPDGNFTLSRRDSLVDNLKDIGLTIEDIDYLALSHTHFDHTGHANELKNATWLVQEAEYDFIASEESQKNNADIYNSIKELTKIEKLKGDHDVFGDGSVVIKSMPGHTPGHQVLFIDLRESGPILLSGDLYHSYENRQHKRMPIFNYDVDQTLKSMDVFEAFAKEKYAKVYIQHQKEDFEKLPVVPNYLN